MWFARELIDHMIRVVCKLIYGYKSSIHSFVDTTTTAQSLTMFMSRSSSSGNIPPIANPTLDPLANVSRTAAYDDDNAVKIIAVFHPNVPQSSVVTNARVDDNRMLTRMKKNMSSGNFMFPVHNLSPYDVAESKHELAFTLSGSKHHVAVHNTVPQIHVFTTFAYMTPEEYHSLVFVGVFETHARREQGGMDNRGSGGSNSEVVVAVSGVRDIIYRGSVPVQAGGGLGFFFINRYLLCACSYLISFLFCIL